MRPVLATPDDFPNTAVTVEGAILTMARRKLKRIDTFAQKLIDETRSPIYPGEYEYVSTGARLVRQQLEKFFDGTGAEPPELKTVTNWFYADCPDWAIAVLSNGAISQN